MDDYQFWEHFDDEQIKAAAGRFFDFSAKLSNSNMQGGVAIRRYADLPYLAVSTLPLGAVMPQSSTNAALARLAKQIIAIKGDLADGYGVKTPEISDRIKFIAQAEISETGKLSPAKESKIAQQVRSEFARTPVPDEEIVRFKAAIDTPIEAGEPAIDQRMKQLLIYDPELGVDVAITPLRSTGLPEAILDAEHRRAAILGNISFKDHQRLLFAKSGAAKKELGAHQVDGGGTPELIRNLFSRCELPLGGTNPQNIGIKLNAAIRAPILIYPRSISAKISHAFSIHYKGVELVRYEVAADLLRALHKEKSSGCNVDSRFKEKMSHFARRIVIDMNHRADIALSQLRENADEVAGKPAGECEDADLFDTEVLSDPIMSGVFLRQRRDNAWRKEYASCVIAYLMRARFRVDGHPELIASEFSDAEASIIRYALEMEAM